MDEYTQNIKLEFISNIDEIEKRLGELKTNIDTNFTSFNTSDAGDKKGFSKEMYEFKDTLNTFKNSVSKLSELFMVQMPTSWSDAMMKVTRGLIGMVKKSFAEMDEMFSYNYLSSQSVRNLRLTWGLNPGEAYAYSNVADMMGISSLEDFSFMSDEELAIFQKSAERLYGVWEEYGSDRSLSDALMEFKVEMQVLKIEVLKPFLEVLTQSEVKENIKILVGKLPDLIEALVNFTTKFINMMLGGEEKESKTQKKVEEMYQGRNVPSYVLKQKSTELEWSPKVLGWLKNSYSNLMKNDTTDKAKADTPKNTITIDNYIDGVKKSSNTVEYSGNKNDYAFSNPIQLYKI